MKCKISMIKLINISVGRTENISKCFKNYASRLSSPRIKLNLKNNDSFVSRM